MVHIHTQGYFLPKEAHVTWGAEIGIEIVREMQGIESNGIEIEIYVIVVEKLRILFARETAEMPPIIDHGEQQSTHSMPYQHHVPQHLPQHHLPRPSYGKVI